MYELALLKLKELPLFSLADVTQIVSGKAYAKKVVKKMVARGEIRKIRRNTYTFHDDPFLMSTFLFKPSYLSSASALSYHQLISQIPTEFFCFSPKARKTAGAINVYPTPYFWGFEEQPYQGFSIPIATPEKALIDSWGIIPVSIFEEAVPEINVKQMKEYLKKIKKSSVLKRMGYLLERNGFEIYSHLKEKINNRYIFFDPLAKKKGPKNKKWKLIVNVP